MPGLREAVELLRRQIRFAHISLDVDFHSLITGSSPHFVQFYRHLLCDHNADVALFLTSNNFLLSGADDRPFMEVVYRICRDVFNTKPKLSLAQFFSPSFAEKKLQMAAELVRSVEGLRRDLARRRATSGAAAVPAFSLARVPSARPGAVRRSNKTGAAALLHRRASSQSLSLHNRANADASQPESSKSRTSRTVSSTPAKVNLLGGNVDNREEDYLPSLLTSLNTLSNKLVHVVDRVAGLEARISAIEKSVLEAAATAHSRLETPREAPSTQRTQIEENQKTLQDSTRTTSTSTLTSRARLVQSISEPSTKFSGIPTLNTEDVRTYRSDGALYNPLSLSETSSLEGSAGPVVVGLQQPAAQPNRPKSASETSSTSDHYSPGFTDMAMVSVHKEGEKAGLKRSTVVGSPQSAFVTTRSPTVMRKAFIDGLTSPQEENKSSVDEKRGLDGSDIATIMTMRQTKDGARLSYINANEAHRNIGRGVPGSGDFSKSYSRRATVPITEEILTISNSNSGAKMESDESLQQQVNRISSLLSETQALLNGRQPLTSN